MIRTHFSGNVCKLNSETRESEYIINSTTMNASFLDVLDRLDKVATCSHFRGSQLRETAMLREEECTKAETRKHALPYDHRAVNRRPLRVRLPVAKYHRRRL